MADCTVGTHKEKLSVNVFNLLHRILGSFFIPAKRKRKQLNVRELPAHIQKDIGANIGPGPSIR